MSNLSQTTRRAFGKDILASWGRSGLGSVPETRALKGPWALVTIHKHTAWSESWNRKPGRTLLYPSSQGSAGDCRWYSQQCKARCDDEIAIDSGARTVDRSGVPPVVASNFIPTQHQANIPEYHSCHPQAPRTTLHHPPGKCCQTGYHYLGVMEGPNLRTYKCRCCLFLW